jgi:amino acid transporter
LIAQFYVAVWPIGGGVTAESFFQSYLAAPIIFTLYVGWKVWSRDWKMWISAKDMDIMTDLRVEFDDDEPTKTYSGFKGKVMSVVHAFF